MSNQFLMLCLPYAAAFFSTSCFIPQAIKIVSSKDTKSVSLIGYLLLFIGVFLWSLYGFCTDQTAILVSNLIVATLVLIILYKKVYNIIKKID